MLPVLIEEIHVHGTNMDVGVGEPRHERHPRAVDDGIVATSRVRPLEVNPLYPLVLDEDRCPLARFGSDAVYEECVSEKRGRSHGVRPPLERCLRPGFQPTLSGRPSQPPQPMTAGKLSGKVFSDQTRASRRAEHEGRKRRRRRLRLPC